MRRPSVNLGDTPCRLVELAQRMVAAKVIEQEAALLLLAAACACGADIQRVVPTIQFHEAADRLGPVFGCRAALSQPVLPPAEA